MNDESTCGEELARDAEVPELLSQLWEHVAQNMEVHARWVGTDSDAARQEHDCLRLIASEYRSVALAAERAAVVMRSMHGLPAAPHDPSRLDRVAQMRWMRRKIDLQVEFAKLLLAHAEESQAVWNQLRL
ncbi:MAG: hypothetical protein QM756_29165, partial [Polyangiaceae bacterium]